MDDLITIVSGLPRSGTSLMMRMLETGGIPALVDGVRAPDIDNPNGYYEYEPVKNLREDASWLGSAGGKAVKMVSQLLFYLPPERPLRIILMRRDLGEILASQKKMLLRLGRGGEFQEPLMAKIFEKHLTEVESWLSRNKNFHVMTVSFNEMLGDPGRVVRKIDGFLGGGLATEKMFAVIDPALYRNRRPATP